MPTRPSRAERRWPEPAGRVPASATIVECSPARPHELGAQEFDVDHREAEGDQKDNDWERRAVPELEILQQSVEGVECDRLGRGPGTSTGQGIDQVEHPERVERSEDQGDQNGRLEQREGYM